MPSADGQDESVCDLGYSPGVELQGDRGDSAADPFTLVRHNAHWHDLLNHPDPSAGRCIAHCVDQRRNRCGDYTEPYGAKAMKEKSDICRYCSNRRDRCECPRFKSKTVVSGEWIQPIRRAYRMECCDCGLVHLIDFRVRKGRAQLRAFRKKDYPK